MHASLSSDRSKFGSTNLVVRNRSAHGQPACALLRQVQAADETLPGDGKHPRDAVACATIAVHHDWERNRALLIARQIAEPVATAECARVGSFCGVELYGSRHVQKHQDTIQL